MRGIVIGKFYPPHMGHNYLIDTALQHCDDVDVLVVDNPAYRIPSERRAEWIQKRHPSAHVRIISDINDDANSPAWALHTLRFLGYTPDIVYSSEPYGRTWAEAMGCRHVDVDISRSHIPISGTKVRQDILKSWNFLSTETKSGLALRIVVVGAESTGTTTLALALARELNVPYVPEIGRYYTESLASLSAPSRNRDYVEVTWQPNDFTAIGNMQQSYEAIMASRSDGVIVCDTNATATQLWQRRYIHRVTPEMKRIAERDIVHLYIITGDDIPFVQDGLRDGKQIRHRMHMQFIKQVEGSGIPYIIVTGKHEDRLKAALVATHRVITRDKKI